jgi:hypothetical protein
MERTALSSRLLLWGPERCLMSIHTGHLGNCALDGNSAMGSWERGGGYCAKRQSDRDTERYPGTSDENKHERTYKVYVYMLNGTCN